MTQQKIATTKERLRCVDCETLTSAPDGGSGEHPGLLLGHWQACSGAAGDEEDTS